MVIETIVKMILSALPSAAYLYLYFRRVGEKRSLPVYVEAFIHGIFVSLLVMLFNSFTHEITVSSTHLVRSFVLAAFMEKILALISVYIIIRSDRYLSARRGICVGIVFGAAFGFVENIQYSFAYSTDILFQRMFFSVPMHIITCGIIGYFLSLRRFAGRKRNKSRFLFLAVVVPILFHGSFDYVLFNGIRQEILIPPMIVGFFLVLEWMISMATTLPTINAMADMKLGFEEWTVLRRHQRHEKWILRTMGKSGGDYSGFLRFGSGVSDIVIAIIAISAGIVFMINAEKIAILTSLRFDEKAMVMLFVSFPLTISLAFLLKGVINPRYFTDGMLRIPVIANAVIYPYSDDEETLITYDITPELMFLKTYDLPESSVFDLMFEAAHSLSPVITVEKRWENRYNPSMPFGVLVTPVTRHESTRMRMFIRRYMRIKYLNGFLFGLGVPGRERIKKYFIRSDTVMKNRMYMDRNSCIYKKGDVASNFYNIQNGKVRIVYDDEKGGIGYTIRRGDYFGVSDVVGDRIRSHSAIAESDCELLVADISIMKTLVDNDPRFSYQVILSLSRLVKQMEERDEKRAT
jgi:RsiW-degrading membrane proteinase PrsW (M82 family)